MLFKVRDLEIKPIRFDHTYAAGEFNFLDEALTQAGPLRAQGQAEYLDSVAEVHVQGEFQVKLASECDRCLEPAGFAVDRKFDLFYRPAKELDAEEEIALKEDETEIGFYDGEAVELEEILREQVLLALPVQKLCRGDCKGLCPSCGVNLNQGQCGCAPVVTATGWGAALREIKLSSQPK